MKYCVFGLRQKKQGRVSQLRGAIFETSAARGVPGEINFLSRARKRNPRYSRRRPWKNNYPAAIDTAAVLRGAINYFISRSGIPDALSSRYCPRYRQFLSFLSPLPRSANFTVLLVQEFHNAQVCPTRNVCPYDRRRTRVWYARH